MLNDLDHQLDVVITHRWIHDELPAPAERPMIDVTPRSATPSAVLAGRLQGDPRPFQPLTTNPRQRSPWRVSDWSGRKPKLSPYQRAEALKRRAAGEPLASIAKSYAVDISMISRLKG